MKFPAWLVMLALLIGVSVGVVLTPSCFSADKGGSSVKSAGGTSQQGEAVLFFVNDEPVYGSELLASVIMRESLLKFIQNETLKQIVLEEGYEVDMADVDAIMTRQKESALAKGDSWESMLRESRLTEEEMLESIVNVLTIEKIAESRAVITDDMLQEHWDRNKDMIVRRYLVNNSIPQNEEETKKVTLEVARDLVFDDVFSSMQRGIIYEFTAEIITKTDLDLACIKDKELKALIEDLVLNISKELIWLEQNASGESEPPAGPSAVDSIGGM